MAFNQAPATTVAAPTVQPSNTNILETVMATGKSVELSQAEFDQLRNEAKSKGLLGGEMRTPDGIRAACKAGITLIPCTVSKVGAKAHRARSGNSVYFSFQFTTNDARFNPAETGRLLVPSDIDATKLVNGSQFQLEATLQPDGETVYCTANFA